MLPTNEEIEFLRVEGREEREKYAQMRREAEEREKAKACLAKEMERGRMRAIADEHVRAGYRNDLERVFIDFADRRIYEFDYALEYLRDGGYKAESGSKVKVHGEPDQGVWVVLK